MFNVLGLVSEDGSWTRPRQKMVEFLNDLNKIEDVQSLHVLVKQGKIKTKQAVDCLNIERVPIILTQFKPTKRRGEEVMEKWVGFMKFVDTLLEYHECYKYIIGDKEKQKLAIKEITDNGGSAIITNQMVNKIMGKLITNEDDFSISKDELKIYQSKITIDLLEARNFVLDKFSTCYALTSHHDKARDLTLKLAQKKYFN